MLKGKNALVTGSTSGIGLAIAEQLASQGANVMLNGFGDFEAAIRRVQSNGTIVRYHAADVSKPSEIEELVATCVSDIGSVDILVNNAGIQHVAAVEDFPIERWDTIIAINLSAAFHTTRCVLPEMKRRNWGRIINIASVHGMVASSNKSAYVAAKHGLVGFTKSVALETATTGITVNAVCPGWVLTPLVEKQIEDRARTQGITLEAAQHQLLSEKQPSLQFTTPQHVAELTTFLCSSTANNVRGVAWNIDGGWLAQ